MHPLSVPRWARLAMGAAIVTALAEPACMPAGPARPQGVGGAADEGGSGEGGRSGSGGERGGAGGGGGGMPGKKDGGADARDSTRAPDGGRDAALSGDGGKDARSADGAKDGARAGGGTDGGAPTFTEVYDRIMSETPDVPASGCWTACHAGPGIAKALAKIDMNTREKAWIGTMKLVVPRNPGASKLYTELATGKMPEKKPKLPPALIQLVADWINAGAPND
jgi:hypothetical protein